MIEDNIFPLVFLKVSINAFNVVSNVSSLWHQRFGHFNFDGLNLLCKKNMVDGHSMVIIEKQ